jgi:hypothetical protein
LPDGAHGGEVQDLEDNDFDELFEEHRDLWEAKAREAYDYAEKLVTPTGEPVRPDDVLELLVPGLVLVDELRDFLDENRLKQKYWKSYFGEFILDRFWTDLTGDEDDEEER